MGGHTMQNTKRECACTCAWALAHVRVHACKYHVWLCMYQLAIRGAYAHRGDDVGGRAKVAVRLHLFEHALHVLCALDSCHGPDELAC